MSHFELNETHSVDLTSWVTSANQAGTDFPIQNLPFAEIRRSGSNEAFRGGVAIGDQVLDLAALHAADIFDGDIFDTNLAEILATCTEPTLNHFMSLGYASWSALRLELSRALSHGSNLQGQLTHCLIPMAEIEYDMPCHIGDYTDFYTSIHHATNVGKLFRPDNPLLPNYKWLPIGYHGRASSIEVSGQHVRRPKGQTKSPDQETPSFGPCKKLDYEMEVGIYIGVGNKLGDSIDLDVADNHVFGYCLFNDWSARDIQAWEYVPLGPFLAKNFASTVSPWIVTNEALLPYRKPWTRDEADPKPMDYLSSVNNSKKGALDIRLQVALQTATMKKQEIEATKLSDSSFACSYWTVAQMVAHHTVNGCNFKPGDFLGSGTQSGPGENELGSLLELTRGGKQAIELPGGEQRTFLDDGDTVIMRGYCTADNAVRIGFGEVVAVVVP